MILFVNNIFHRYKNRGYFQYVFILTRLIDSINASIPGKNLERNINTNRFRKYLQYLKLRYFIIFIVSFLQYYRIIC